MTPDRGRFVAELKAVQPDQGLTLSRWSRLKRAAVEEQAPSAAARTEPVEVLVPSERNFDELSQNGKANAASTSRAYDELPPISAISLTEDFTPFMQAKVPQALKQQALKALFKEPHFNVMDGLDIYIDDYTVFEPISPEVMATLSSWKTIMNPPKQVVTNGGYAVDVESDEGKAVLAARNAEIAKAEREGGDMPQPRLQTSDPSSKEEPPPLSNEASATAPTSSPAQTCAVVREPAAAEGAKPHVRYGKRVGDFSALAHEIADDTARESFPSELDQTASAAPKSITQ